MTKPIKVKSLKKGLLSPVKEIACTPTAKNMGVGRLGDPEMKFARKFRWTMEGQNLPSMFFKSVDIDYKNKKINFEYYEVADGEQGFHGLVWADELDKRHLVDETLLFKTYDGCGNTLYEVEFTDLKLLANTTDFNYSTSEESVRKITVSYCFARPKLVACQRALAVTKWTMDILVNYKNKIENLDVTVFERPSINIEESQIDHLNSSVKLPGKATMQPVKLRFQKTKDAEFINNIISGKPQFFEVHLHQYRGDECLETWELTDGWFRSLKFSGEDMDAELVYKSMRYRHGACHEGK